MARAAFVALRSSGSGSKSARSERDLDKFASALVQTSKSKKRKCEDVLEHYTQLDCTEKYESMNKSPEEALALWHRARAGRFPPWVPTESRGAESVARLAPERVVKSKSAKVVEKATSNRSYKQQRVKDDPRGGCGRAQLAP